MSETIVELLDVNGEWWNLTEGDRGVYLGTDPKGLYDPPVKTVYEEPGNWPGARYLNHRILRRDITFIVGILNDKHLGGDTWMSRDSEWRRAWAFDQDCKLYVTTPESGTRYLHLRLGESPEVSLFTDPNDLTWNQVMMTCIAGDVFWYQDDVVYSAVTETDTTFDPAPLPWPWPQPDLPTETITITVDPSDGKGGLNPTDQGVFIKWTMPGSTEAPSAPYIPGIPWLGAPKSPATIWTIPDYSFTDEDQANRRLRMPGLIGGLRTEEVQAFYINGKPTSGNFTLTYDGNLTSNIAWNASTAAVQAALVALAPIAFADVKVDRAAATNEVQLVSMKGGPTSGTFTLTFNGETTAGIPFNATEGQVRTALINLASVGNNDVTVDATSVNEVQVITPVGEPTAGTFKLTFDGQTTAPIDWDASAFQVQQALIKLSNIGNSDVSVKKASGQYQPWKITFKNSLFGGGGFGGIDLQPIVADPTGLSGGAGIDLLVSTETEGSTTYLVTFKGSLAGFEFDLMTANPAGLSGGLDPDVEIVGVVDGSRPYLVTFTGALSGLDVPELEIDTSGLSGGTGISGRVETLREGVTHPAENAVIDTDPRVEQVAADNGSQLWARMNGVRFRNPVPPYTKSKTFEVTVSGAIPGQMITLRIPRPWTRPWGLE